MSQQHSRAREIVGTLIDLVEQRGVENVTTAALARRLGFTEAALYRYYPGKAAILAAALQSLAEDLFATMAVELSTDGGDAPPEDVVGRLTRHVDRFTARQGALLEILMAATTGRESELQEAGNAFLEEYFHRMAAYFQRLVELGVLERSAAPRELASLWTCQLLGGFVRSRLTRTGWTPEEHEGFRAFVARLASSALVSV